MVGFCVLDKKFFRDWLPTFAPTTGIECLQNSNHYGFKPFFLWGRQPWKTSEKIQGKIFAECHGLMTSNQKLPLYKFVFVTFEIQKTMTL